MHLHLYLILLLSWPTSGCISGDTVLGSLCVSQSHRVTEWFGLEDTLQIISFQWQVHAPTAAQKLEVPCVGLEGSSLHHG